MGYFYSNPISTKVILYGNNTKGEIDYTDVNTIHFGGKGNKVYYLVILRCFLQR